MVEKILENVVNEMAPHLSQDQLEHLSNVLYVNFHGLEVAEQCTELAATGEDGDEAKIRMFVASKKAVNRQTNTLKQYTGRSAICWISWGSAWRILPVWICGITMV